VKYIKGLEYDLLKVVYEEMDMTFVHLPMSEGFELLKVSVNNLIFAMFAKEAYIA
jgi:hypothetical protein